MAQRVKPQAGLQAGSLDRLAPGVLEGVMAHRLAVAVQQEPGAPVDRAAQLGQDVGRRRDGSVRRPRLERPEAVGDSPGAPLPV